MHKRPAALRHQSSSAQLPLPTDTSIQKIATLLETQIRTKERKEKYAPVGKVLALLGKGAVLTSVILAPGTAKAFASLLRDTPDYDAWKQFNRSYLQRTLRMLQKQKHIELVVENGQEVIKLTQNGKRKILQYSLTTLTIAKQKQWDGLWRIVMFDIPKDKEKTRNPFRQMLRRLGFYQMQKSVYLLPYPCFEEIEFLRQYYFLDITVQYVLVKQIENDDVYRTYFSLKS